LKSTKKKSSPSRPTDRVNGATVRRLMGYINGKYKRRFFLVLVLIVISALVSVASSLFIGNVIDDYITPMLTSGVADFAPLLKIIAIMAVIYVIGVCATLFYNRVMVTIAQGVLKTSGMRCSPAWKNCPSNTSTPIPTATS